MQGHTRWKALKQLGKAKAFVVKRDFPKGQAMAYRIMDNRSGEESKWSNKLLASELNILKDENFDLVLSGLQSDDTGMGQTGVLVGELLNMSVATLAIQTDIDKEKIRVKRELESGWFQWVTLGSSASVTIQSGINQPRYPSLKGIMGAKKKEIKVIESLSLDRKQSVDKVFVPQTSKETEIIDTDLNSAVNRIVEILKTEVKVF